MSEFDKIGMIELILKWVFGFRENYVGFFEAGPALTFWLTFWMWNFKLMLYYPELFPMNFNEVIQLIWIDLSCPEVNSSKKAILEYRPNFKKVSVLLNLEWGKFPLGIESYVQLG